MSRHCGADPLRHLRNIPRLFCGSRSETLATAAHEEILPAPKAETHFADPAQDLTMVCGLEAIVDLLEVIEIQHDEAGEMPLHPVVILVEEEVAAVEAGLIRTPRAA